jgi:hypothetical protein
VDTAGLGAGAATSAEVHICRQTPLQADTQAEDARDTRLIVPLVLALVGLVLALVGLVLAPLLRSQIAPPLPAGRCDAQLLRGTGCMQLRLPARRGAGRAVLRDRALHLHLARRAGADYTIFLISRVREETVRRGLEAAVPVAVGRTGGVITSAGLILAETFVMLTTLPPTPLYQFGVCFGVGVLLDTFVVRGLLVPGTVLLGRWNWWPGRVRSLAPAPIASPPPTPSSAGEPALR